MGEIRQSLKMYNSLDRTKQTFEPMNAPEVLMYICGITVYDYCHIGHAKAMVSFDTISRYLRAVGYQVKFVRNITDIDDKIIRRAEENNEPFMELTERFIEAMHADCRALNVMQPDLEPRATRYIEEIIAMIQRLISTGYAYVADNGDVYYEVSQFERYGQLSQRNLDELQVGIRVDVEKAKRSPLDFVLWKMAKPNEPAWDSPWGSGRPGWHIECSAMSTCCLGKTIDIHGGGGDLLFPHHENEVAQSEAATGQPFVRYWLHNGFVQMDDEKMSKSLGNFFTIRDVLKSYHGEVVRYFIVAGHYRSQLNFSDALLQSAEESVNRFYQALRQVEGLNAIVLDEWSLLVEPPTEAQAALPNELVDHLRECRHQFMAAMDDDFNTPKALAVLHELVSILNRMDASELSGRLSVAAEIKGLGGILGLFNEMPERYFQGDDAAGTEAEAIEALIAARNLARAQKAWSKADDIRDQLKAMGVVLEDKAGKTIWRKGS